jgi:hypothetical protein
MGLLLGEFDDFVNGLMHAHCVLLEELEILVGIFVTHSNLFDETPATLTSFIVMPLTDDDDVQNGVWQVIFTPITELRSSLWVIEGELGQLDGICYVYFHAVNELTSEVCVKQELSRFYMLIRSYLKKVSAASSKLTFPLTMSWFWRYG